MVRYLSVIGFLVSMSFVGIQPAESSASPKIDKYKDALNKAVSYARKNYKKDGLSGHVYAGLMFLVKKENSSDLQACVDYCVRAIKQGGYNRNWYLGMCMYFLSEYYLRYPSGKARNAMVSALNSAQSQMEDTGGWCHHKGMWKKNNYHKRGGGKDLGMVTSMMYGGMLNMKAGGISIPNGLMKRVRKNLESISDGYGFTYGTNNKWGDITMSRAGYVFMGLSNGQMKDDPFYGKIVQGLEKRIKSTEKGHAFAPLHWYSAAVASHRAGLYDKFESLWVDKLVDAMDGSGKISLKCDRGDKYAKFGANAACLAIILLLREKDAFPPKGKKPKGGVGEDDGNGGNGSPFGSKKKNPAPQETPSSSKPKPEPKKNKKSPFGRD